MDPTAFTDDENWHGGYYELAIDLGLRNEPGSDVRLSRALRTVWSDPHLEGCYLDRWRPRTDQERVSAALTDPDAPAPLYGNRLRRDARWPCHLLPAHPLSDSAYVPDRSGSTSPVPVAKALDGSVGDRHDVGGMGYPTPEEAALAEWASHPQAEARVIEIRYTDKDHAVVVTDTVPSHPMNNYCERTSEGWVFTGDNN